MDSGLEVSGGNILKHQLVKPQIRYQALGCGVLLQLMRLIYPPAPMLLVLEAIGQTADAGFPAGCWRRFLIGYVHFNLLKRLTIHAGLCFSSLVRSDAPLVSICPSLTCARFTWYSNFTPKPRHRVAYFFSGTYAGHAWLRNCALMYIINVVKEVDRKCAAYRPQNVAISSGMAMFDSPG
jgi:hypothetical protein